MDLRVYYQQVRQAEAEIKEPHVVVVSKDTSDGGKAGRMTEVSRESAALLLVEGRARLASTEETAEYQRVAAEKKKAADEEAVNKSVAKVTEPELRILRAAMRSKG